MVQDEGFIGRAIGPTGMFHARRDAITARYRRLGAVTDERRGRLTQETGSGVMYRERDRVMSLAGLSLHEVEGAGDRGTWSRRLLSQNNFPRAILRSNIGNASSVLVFTCSRRATV